MPKNRQSVNAFAVGTVCSYVCICVLKLFQFHCCFVLRLPPLLCRLSPCGSFRFVHAEQLKNSESFLIFFLLYIFCYFVLAVLALHMQREAGKRGEKEAVGKPLNALRGEAPEMVRQMEWQSSPPQGNPCQAAASPHSFNCQFAIVLVAASSRSN